MINRKALYAGVFLAAAGAVMLLAQGEVARETVVRGLELWPLAVIALGVGFIVRRTRLGLVGGVLAAAMPGLLFGGVVAAAPDVSPDCTVRPAAGTEARSGTFDGAASVELVLDCGEITVTSIPGGGWTVEASSSSGAGPIVDASADRLSVVSGDRGRHPGFGWSGDLVRVALPASTVLDLSAEVNAGRGRFDLAGGRFGDLALEVNAGDARLDLAGAALSRLRVHVNAGRATVFLPGGSDLQGEIEVNAGAAAICAPDDLGLRITEEDAVLGGTTFNGLVRNGSAWESPNYATAAYQADLSVSVNVGSVDVNAQGGCK
jgi:hypothetical protein